MLMILWKNSRQEYIDEMIVNLEEAGMQLEAEDDVAGFLGVLIERWEDGTILMTQPELTLRIVRALKIDHLLSTKRTPINGRQGGAWRVQLSKHDWYEWVPAGP
jgi:hypothetical protein